MLSAAILAAGLVAGEGAWTQIITSSQLECKTPYLLTVGYPQGKKELYLRIEKDNVMVVEQKLPKYMQAESGVMDVDDSGCNEALIDLTDDINRTGVFVSFPAGVPKVIVFPTTTVDASKAKRFSSRIQVFWKKKSKLCVTDYRVQKDTLNKQSEACY